MDETDETAGVSCHFGRSAAECQIGALQLKRRSLHIRRQSVPSLSTLRNQNLVQETLAFHLNCPAIRSGSGYPTSCHERIASDAVKRGQAAARRITALEPRHAISRHMSVDCTRSLARSLGQQLNARSNARQNAQALPSQLAVDEACQVTAEQPKHRHLPRRIVAH